MKISNNIQEIQSKIDNYETKANSIRVIQKSPCHIILSIFTLGILAIVRACILGDLECKIKNLKDRINVIKNQSGNVKEGDKNNSRAKTHRIKFDDKVAVLPFNHMDAPGEIFQNHSKAEESINLSGDTRSHDARFRKSHPAAFEFKLAELQALENSGVNRSTVAVNIKEVLLPPNEGLKGILKGAKSTQPKRVHFEPV